MFESNTITESKPTTLQAGDRVELTRDVTFPLEMSARGGVPAEKQLGIKRGTIGTVSADHKDSASAEISVSFPAAGVRGGFFVHKSMLRKFFGEAEGC